MVVESVVDLPYHVVDAEWQGQSHGAEGPLGQPQLGGGSAILVGYLVGAPCQVDHLHEVGLGAFPLHRGGWLCHKVPHIGHEKGQSLLATLHALSLLFKFGVHAVIVFVNA